LAIDSVTQDSVKCTNKTSRYIKHKTHENTVFTQTPPEYWDTTLAYIPFLRLFVH